jgi:hypothetical protein
MIDNNLLWSRVIDPISSGFRKEPTFLGVVLIALGLAAIGYVAIVLFAVL